MQQSPEMNLQGAEKDIPGNIEISREYPLDIHLFPHHPLSGNNIEGIPLEYLNSIKSFFCYSGNIPRISENWLIPL